MDATATDTAQAADGRVRAVLRAAEEAFPLWLQAAVGAVAALTVLWEIDRLVAGLVDEGRSHTLAQVVAPGALLPGPRSSWGDWAQAEEADRLVWFVLAHVLADAVLVVAYAGLARRAIRVPAAPVRRGATTVLTVLVVAELAEAVALLGTAVLAGDGRTSALPALGWVVAALSTGKWVAAAVLVVLLARSRPLRAQLGARLRLLAGGRRSALWYQRLSVLVIALVVGLSVLPGTDVLDQLPDVQRAWFPSATSEDPGRGWWSWHATVATVLTGLLCLALLVVGRRRTQQAHRTHVSTSAPAGPADPFGAAWWRQQLWWFVGPVLVMGTAVALVLTGGGERVGWWLAGGFAAAPLLLVLVSAGWDRWRAAEQGQAVVRRPGLHRVTRRTGDALAGLLLALAAIGLLRSMTAPVLLRWAGGEPAETGQVVSWVMGVLVVGVGARAATTALVAAAGRTPGWVLTDEDATDRQVRRRDRVVVGAVLVAAAAVLVALIARPAELSDTLGVIGTVQVAVLGWLVVLAFPVLHLQGRPPLRVFRALRLQATPVLTLLVAVPLLVQLVPGATPPRLHAVAAPLPAPPATTPGDDAGPVDRRPELDDEVDAWLARTSGCAGPGGARPMVLVAAAGGGIRAATWTAHGMAALRDLPCGQDAVLLGSGVSGGSVGLVASRADDPVGEVEALADHRALAAATSGLLVGDVVGGSTGLLLSDGPWADRAALMEERWRTSATELSEPFVPTAGQVGPELVLNSTATSGGCRVLVSTVDLRGWEESDGQDRTPPGREIDCRGADPEQLAGAVDLADLLGPACTPELDGATAAMLSARFPFVTPAGVVPPPGAQGCDVEEVQLIDGGYAEGSGLATVSELLPAVMARVATHNARQPGDVVVPVVVLLHNRPGADLAGPGTEAVLEPLVPVEGFQARKAFGQNAVWLQRVAQQIAEPCGGVTACEEVVDRIDTDLGGRVVVYAPQTEPAVEPPLGWVLSQDSRTRLAGAADAQGEQCLRVDGYGCLRDLLTEFGAAS